MTLPCVASRCCLFARFGVAFCDHDEQFTVLQAGSQGFADADLLTVGYHVAIAALGDTVAACKRRQRADCIQSRQRQP